jgi:hypothetical protein
MKFKGTHWTEMPNRDEILKRIHHFPKGHKPWNTGLKGFRAGIRRVPIGFKQTLETRKKMSEAKIKSGFTPTPHFGEDHWNWKGGRFCIDCKVKIARHGAKRCKMCNGKLHSGANNNFWKGGISQFTRPERSNIMGTTEYKLWRKAVFQRDHYKCTKCGDDKGGNLEADHIKPFALYPELRFAIDNGQTLCTNCHREKNVSDRIEFISYNYIGLKTN